MASEPNVNRRTIGALDCVIVDRLAEGEMPKAITIVCHGYGASGTDLVGIAPYWLANFPKLASGMRFVFPAAPMVLGMGMMGESRAWFPIDIEALERSMATGEPRIRRDEMPDELEERNAEIREIVKVLSEETGLSVGQFAFGGFSQGSMLTTDVVLSLEEAPLGQVIFSGTLLCEDRWKAAASKRDGFSLFMSHGRQDPLLRIEEAEALRDVLVEAGLRVEFLPFDGEHTIGDAALHRAGEYLSNCMERLA